MRWIPLSNNMKANQVKSINVLQKIYSQSSKMEIFENKSIYIILLYVTQIREFRNWHAFIVKHIVIFLNNFANSILKVINW